MTPSQTVTAAAAAFTLGAMRAAQERPGNPRGVHIQRFGEVTAICARAAPEHDFMNSLLGLHAADAGRLPAITDFYRGHGVRGWTEVAPGPDAEAVIDALAAAGWRQVGFHASFAGPPPQPLPVAPAQVSVREVGIADAATFGRVLAGGHEVPEADLAQARAEMGGWAGHPGWRVYLAELDGRPAAAAVLTLQAGVAYLANASTLSHARGRGCQRALLARRMADAADAELICALAAFGSASHRNLLWAGLALTHTQAVWRMAS